MTNPQGFVHIIEHDGSEWYEKPGVDARIAELEADLKMAYENADFDEPLTLEEYRADLQGQAAARAEYEAQSEGGER